MPPSLLREREGELLARQLAYVLDASPFSLAR